MKRRLAAFAALLLLGACKTVPQDYVEFHAGQDQATVAGHLAERIGACWFDGKHKAFADYSYAPEPNMTSTRILIVPKAEPHGLPVLIVEVLKAKRGTDVRLFGPLMQGGDADVLRGNIRAWTGGSRDC